MANLVIFSFIVFVFLQIKSSQATTQNGNNSEVGKHSPNSLTELLYRFESLHYGDSGNRSARHSSSHRHHSDCGFKCNDGTCVKSHNRCDNIVQCPDSSDEVGCKCSDKVGSKKICDGYADCPLGEDEENCSSGCKADEFSCSGTKSGVSTSCIQMSQLCDGHVDCISDHSDETACYRLTAFDIAFRGILNEGYLQKRIGASWHTVCKSYSKLEERLIVKYAKKACEVIVGDVDEDPVVTVVLASDILIQPDLLLLEPLVFAKLADKESKFQSSSTCSSEKVYKIVCPDPKCGWPASHYDKYYVSQTTQHNFQTSAEHYIYRRADYNSHGLTAKIVGGHDSTKGNWPFIAGIYRNGTFHCGASILNKQWILTAAHCTHGYEKFVFEAQAGMVRRNSYSPEEQTRQITEIHVHERYDSKIFFNDIALMKLDAPLYLSKWVTTACFATALTEDPKAGQDCTVIGWGDLAEDGLGPDHLQEVALPVLDKCLETFTKDSHQICAAVLAGGKDACQGDSGGPLICPAYDGKYIVNGLVSFGRGCARPNQAGVYTRISAYTAWIDGVINGENPYTKLQKPPKLCDYKCYRDGGECLFSKYSCDSHVHCLGMEDELNCKYGSRASSASAYDDADEHAYEHIRQASHATVEHVHEYGAAKLCGPTEFQCKTTLSCIPLELKCNGIFECFDHTDEKHCECGAIIDNAYPELTCDSLEHCLDGTDEEDCQSKNCDGQTGMIECPNSEVCISESSFCDGKIDCPFASDEIDCVRIKKSKGKLPSKNSFLEDRLSRGLTQGYVIIRTKGKTWRKACSEDFKENINNVVCQSLGLSTEVISSRKPRSTLSWNEEFWRRRRDTAAATGECHQVKVQCGESPCGQRKLYSMSTQTPISSLVGAQPWIASVLVEGEFVCAATLVHKQWILASSECIDNNVRSTTNEYLSASVGFSKASHLVTSTMEQVKRINSIVKLADGLALLRVENSFTADQFVTPICTSTGYAVSTDKPICVRIKVQNGTIYEKPAAYDATCDSTGQQCIKLNPSRCKYVSDYFVYCSFNEKKWFLHGYADATSVSNCSPEGQIVLKNPFYGADGPNTKELFNRPVSSIIKPPPCSGTRCTSGTCVASQFVCDGINQCQDGLDEQRCQGHFQRLLRSHDEEEYHPQSYLNISRYISKCPIGHFKCKMTGNCVPISAFCDDNYDCGYDDHTDEPDASMCTCRHYLELAAPETICDAKGESTCPDRGDELGCPCTKNSFVCDRGSSTPQECIHKNLVCDSVRDCKNGRDEKFCTAISSSLTKIQMDRSRNFLEGYVLVRIKGSWHPYCTAEWSLDLAQEICTLLGYKQLKELNTYGLDDLNSGGGANGYSTEEAPKLWLLGKTHRYEGLESGPINEIITETSGESEEYSCTLGHITCTK